MAFAFLDLPQEIRNAVYRIHFRNIQVFVSCEDPHQCEAPSTSQIELFGWLRCDEKHLNLTLASKQICREAMPEFFKHAIFDLRGFHSMDNEPPKHWHAASTPAWQIQHFIDCLSRVHRIRINVFNLRVSELLSLPRKLGSTIGLKVGSFSTEVLKEVVVFDRLWSYQHEQVSDVAKRLVDSQDIANIRRLVTEAKQLVVFLVVQISIYPTQLPAVDQRHKVRLRIKDGKVTILIQPEFAKAQEVMRMYMRLVGLEAANAEVTKT